MPYTDNLTSPIIGMNQDLNLSNLDEKTYTYALNASIENFDGQGLPVIQNTPSNILAINLPEGYKIIGNKTIIEQDRVILMLVNPSNGKSQIGEYRNCTYNDYTDRDGFLPCLDCHNDFREEATPLEKVKQTPYCSYRTIKEDVCFNFNIDHPVDIEYKITDCSLNIYFTDNYNERRYIYFEYENDDVNGTLKIQQKFFKILGYYNDDCKQPIYSNEVDCNKIKYHPDYQKPCIAFIDLIGGGSLKSGSYQFLTAYSNVNGIALTNYSEATNIIPIRTKDITVATDYDTDRAIHIKINNLETSNVFSYYNLVVAETIDNFTQFKLVGTFNVTNNQHIYTGNDKLLKRLSTDDIFFRYPFYKTAKSVTKSNDYLFFSNLKEFKKYNLQPVAEYIKFYWQTVAVSEPTYKDPKNTFYLRGYNRDEVYALGIVFEASNGEELCAIHVPGPTRDYILNRHGIDVDIPVFNDDVINDDVCNAAANNKYWQVYNTAVVIGRPHQFTDNCEELKPWEYGDFSYWESIDKYPNDPIVWGNLCGKPIRHHKFPDSCVTHIHDGLGTSKGYHEDNIVFPIGIKIDNDSVIAALNVALNTGLIDLEQFRRIKRYRIVRGNRSGNKSIVAKGLIYDIWDYSKNGQTYYYPNYPYNDLRPDPYISTDRATYNVPDSSHLPYRNNFRKTGRYTFHSPDTHFVNPKLGTQLKLETEEYGQSEGYFIDCKYQAKHRFLSTASYALALGLGIAAAISATGEKECTTYETTADYKQVQVQDGKMFIGTGGSFSNILTPGILTAGTGTSGTSGNIDTHISASQQALSLGERKEQHNNPYSQPEFNFRPYDLITGQPDLTTVNVTKLTKTTCTGQPHQVFNSNILINILLTFFGVSGNTVQRIILGLFEMRKVIETLEALIPYKNFHAQYNSVGKYNNYRCIPNNFGEKRRSIGKSAYLDTNIQSINDSNSAATQVSNTIFVNNYNRESSVYLKTSGTLLPNTMISDESRYVLSEKGKYADLYQRYYAPISSYYASIKNYVPDQYGSVNRINYLDTGCTFDIGDTTVVSPVSGPPTTPTNYGNTVFGGDTFINRFALKRKMSFFLQSTFKQLTGADIRYEELGNVGYPNFYMNTGGSLVENLSGLTSLAALLNPLQIGTLLGVARNRLDTNSDGTNNLINTDGIKFFYQRGRVYLYNYGVPYFFTESDVNVDYRHAENDTDKDYYPRQKDLDFWFEEYNVAPKIDNYYIYNSTFSKQNIESIICNIQPDFKPNKECSSIFTQRIIYSEQTENNNSLYDSWLVFKANDYYDFPLTNGELITADGIENDKVLVRFKNTLSIFSAYNTIQSSGDNIQIGTGGIFASRPKNFVASDLGYAGTQHRALLKTEHGHITIDAKRGQIFNIDNSGGGMEEISRNGMRNWFKENLPFTLKKQFSNIPDDDLDNNFKGLGIHMVFDKRYSQLYVTKLDYVCVDRNVKYDESLKKFFFRQGNNMVFVELTNPKYFCNKSWTVSYNFFTKSWISFHSFIPNVYIDWIEYYQSATGGSIWSHGVTNKSYQVFNGKLKPFTVETHSKPEIGASFINNLEYKLDAIRYHNTYDWFYNDTINFNKLIIYNNKQCSGLRNLISLNPNDLSLIGQYPKIVNNGVEVEATNVEGLWSVNDFYDCTASPYNNLPFFINHCSNADKDLNPKALNYYKENFDYQTRLRNDSFYYRFTNDKYSNYKLIFNYVLTKSSKSLR